MKPIIQIKLFNNL